MNAKIPVSFVLLAAVTVSGCKNYSPTQPPASGPQATVVTATGDIATKVQSSEPCWAIR
jgi:hypothetical protein